MAIIISPENAEEIRGISPFKNCIALDPRPLANGSLVLSEKILNDPLHEDIAAFLSGLPTSNTGLTYASTAEVIGFDYPVWRNVGVRPFNTPRTWGSEWITDYARDWLGNWITVVNREWSVNLPLTLAAGQADGRIPVDAIDYSTGNDGGAFANWNDWIDAQIAQDKPGALGVDLTPASMSIKHLPRGLYGYGSQMPKITFPSRQSARLSTKDHDVTIRGIEFVNYGWVLRNARRQVPLTIGGVVDTNPYNSGNSGEFINARSEVATEGTRSYRVGYLEITGDVDLTQVVIKRRPVNGLQVTAPVTWEKWEDFWEGAPDSHPTLLSGPITGATPTNVAADINANTATTGYRAQVVGDRCLLFCNADYIEPLVLEPEFTGTGSVVARCEGVAVDISCCKMTDGNCFYGGISETTPHGPLRIFCNVGKGSWGLVMAAYLRKTYVRISNNEWSDTLLTRPTAPGRTNNRMPSGTGSNAYNTVFYLGVNAAWLNEFGYSDELYENNWLHDCESVNNTDTNNCCTGFHILGSMSVFLLDDKSPGGQLSISWNKIHDMIGLRGAEDGNAIYAKPCGILVKRNWIKNTGSGWWSSSFDGAEATGVVIKELRTFVDMPATILEGNVYEDMPHGCAIVKVDNQRNRIIRYEHFKNYTNEKNGVSIEATTSGGCIRNTGQFDDCVIHSIFLENVNMMSYLGAINMYDMRLIGTGGVGSTLEVSNIVAQNDGSEDYPEYTANTTLIRAYIGVNAPSNATTFWNAQLMGHSFVKNAAGESVGDLRMFYQNSSSIQTGSDNASEQLFEDYDPLA